MANVVVTGGAGFVGSRLARELLAAGSLGLAGGGPRPLSRLVLIDRVPVPPDLAADGRVAQLRGDLGELLAPAGAGRDALAGADVVFHLAAAVSAECEADFDLGIRANLRVTESLRLTSCIRAPRCRATASRPRAASVFSRAAAGSARLRVLVRTKQAPAAPASAAR